MDLLSGYYGPAQAEALAYEALVSAFKQIPYGQPREQFILDQITAGNTPDFLKSYAEVSFPLKNHQITLWVARDYLALGTNFQFLRVPLNPLTAQRLCDAVDATLPTRKMVNLIWRFGNVKLPPQPWGPPYNSEMLSAGRIIAHNQRIEQQRKNQTGLIVGHKKDVVISKLIENRDDKVAIYGWHRVHPPYPKNKHGVPIQGPGINAHSHEITYADYSHGIRLVSQVMKLDGQEMRVEDLLRDSKIAHLLSDEGVFVAPHYPRG